MGRPLILVAASGLAREVLSLVRAHGTYDVVGFLDDDIARHGTMLDGVPVLGGLDSVVDHPEPDLLVCAGRGAVRERIVERLDDLGVFPIRYATVIHPGVEVPAGCEVGVGLDRAGRRRADHGGDRRLARRRHAERHAHPRRRGRGLRHGLCGRQPRAAASSSAAPPTSA